ncbi:hypothetical protein B0H13DRAFT_1609707 [Mycena leptocephala]|nr:hypothetical protein B0H13DRAFT_1609707 [Mycena leptocephala]
MPHTPLPVCWDYNISRHGDQLSAGFLNLTGTMCFANSSIQVLFHTPPIARALSEHTQSRCRSIPFGQKCSRRSALSVSLFQSLTPSSALSSNLRPNRQEDAQEFSLGLMRKLAEQMPTTHDTPPADIFLGRLVTTISCKGCDQTQTTEPNAFRILSVPIHQPSIASVDDALQFFLAPSPFIGYQCEVCKTGTDATNTTAIDRAPAALVIHLLRFEYGNTARKITRPIAHPSSLSLPLADKSLARYELYGAISHLGTSVHEGHYTAAFIDITGRWVSASDMSIKPEEPEKLPNVYMLYYKCILH